MTEKRNLEEEQKQLEAKLEQVKRARLEEEAKPINDVLVRWQRKINKQKQDDAKRRAPFSLVILPFAQGRVSPLQCGKYVRIEDHKSGLWDYREYKNSDGDGTPIVINGQTVESLMPELPSDIEVLIRHGVCWKIIQNIKTEEQTALVSDMLQKIRGLEFFVKSLDLPLEPISLAGTRSSYDWFGRYRDIAIKNGVTQEEIAETDSEMITSASSKNSLSKNLEKITDAIVEIQSKWDSLNKIINTLYK